MHTHSHTNLNTYIYTADKSVSAGVSQALRSESVLHDKNRNWNGEKMMAVFFYLCMRLYIFVRMCACAQFCVSARECISRVWARGRENRAGVASQGLFTSVGRLAEMLFPLLYLDLLHLHSGLSAHPVWGGRGKVAVASHQCQQSHYQPPALERKSFAS